MRRHLLEHDDFEVFVVTSGELDDPSIPNLRVSNPPWLDRLGRTRLWKFVRNFEMLAWSRRVTEEMLKVAREFDPDVILTVADLTLSEAARRLALRLHKPLICNFQDWWPRGQFFFQAERPFPPLVPLFERRFRRLCEQSALAFCTSEGMKEFLGAHPNSHVLYPICSNEPLPVYEPPTPRIGKRRLLYTGTAFGAYGRMLLGLADLLKTNPDWELVIYGAEPDWPPSVIRAARDTGLYRGFLPFEKLKEELRQADACLAVMSFENQLETMMRTSFTTKFLDYCAAGRPVILWGPSYCSPSMLAKREKAALVVETPEAEAVVAQLRRLSDATLFEQLCEGSRGLAKGVLSHGQIHDVFVSNIRALVGKKTLGHDVPS